MKLEDYLGKEVCIFIARGSTFQVRQDVIEILVTLQNGETYAEGRCTYDIRLDDIIHSREELFKKISDYFDKENIL
jgi:hypothetical protein